MNFGQRIAEVMLVCNAEMTLEKTVRELSDDIDIKILLDGSSKNEKSLLSRKQGAQKLVRYVNCGYESNLQTRERETLAAGR
jgi:hypothetical protein